ncbi:hypothetical protein BRADI_4g06512v3 [Brachypodium distachyon]|uniref:Uncharacterized protein n=1 Tax=Brachypodium distachyon TaxID=15368 RepID=A0A2K2CKV3_BRADI|nr:hypothetical protein BRADI_4g06512v3 [Brachypodium distachyon]
MINACLFGYLARHQCLSTYGNNSRVSSPATSAARRRGGRRLVFLVAVRITGIKGEADGCRTKGGIGVPSFLESLENVTTNLPLKWIGWCSSLVQLQGHILSNYHIRGSVPIVVGLILHRCQC